MDDDGDNMNEPLIMALLHISIAKLRRLVSNFNLCQYLDYVLCDISQKKKKQLLYINHVKMWFLRAGLIGIATTIQTFTKSNLHVYLVALDY